MERSNKPERRSTATVNRRLVKAAIDGAFTLEMANAAGVSARSVQRRADNGQLVRMTRTTYALAGCANTFRTIQRAALLASRSRALGLWSASYEHRCVDEQPRVVHVVIRADRRVIARDWMEAHALRELEDDEITELWELPVCTMARTIRDLAAVLAKEAWAEKQLAKLTHEALLRGRLQLDELSKMLERERSPHVSGRLEALIAYESGRDTADLKSEGEAWLRDLVVRRGWPMPRFNARIPGTNKDGDAYWEKEGVVVEFDGFQVHRTRRKHDADRRRDRLVRRRGIVTLRITSTDFRHHLRELEDDIALALGVSSSGGGAL